MVNPAGGTSGPGGARTAFRLWELHRHRGKNSVTCLALNESSDWLYLGFSDGQLEEHRLEAQPGRVHSSLSARKAVSKKPIDDIRHLVGARRLAVLSDGSVSLLDCDSLEKAHLPGAKGVTALAAEPTTGYPSRVAVATKVVLTTKKRARLSLYKVRGGSLTAEGGSAGAAASMFVKSLDLDEGHSLRRMAWTGGTVVAATNYRYLVVSLRDGAITHLFDAGAGQQPPPEPPMLAPFPASQAAILVMEQVGLIVNGAGAPVRSTLAFPSKPLAFAQCGLYILGVFEDCVRVFDETTSHAVQAIPLAACGGEDPWACAGGTISGACVALAGRSRAWMLQPVGLEDQARELLGQRAYEAAEALATSAGPEGSPPPWRDVVLAEMALLQLHELDFAGGLETMRRVPLQLLGPASLFPLFPEAAGPWLRPPAAEGSGNLWGVAPPLADLKSMVHRRVEKEGMAGRPEEDAVLDAKRAVASYLTEAREWPGVGPAEGIDTLLLRLLVDIEDVAAVERLASGENSVDLKAAEGVLEGAGRSHALALLLAGHGRHSAALAVWHDLAHGQRAEAPAAAGAVAEAVATGAEEPCARLAEACARDALLKRFNSASTRQEALARLAAQYLPWLLDAGAGRDRGRAGLEVLRCRGGLPVAEALRLLSGRPARLRWRYLLHAVMEWGDTDPSRHEELAQVLTKEVLVAMDRWRPAASAAAADEMDDEPDAMRRHLQHFLQSSDLYSVRDALKQMQGTELWHEQVILHGKLGSHSAALRILAIRLKDTSAALKYCAKPGREGCHALLLRIFLTPGDGLEPMLHEACLLLGSSGGATLDPKEVLDAMPAELPLQSALPTIGRILRERIHRAREQRVVCALQRSVNLEAKGELAELQQQRVVITDERACAECHTRIGTRMFAALPGGAALCYRCYQQSREETGSGGQQLRP